MATIIKLWMSRNNLLRFHWSSDFTFAFCAFQKHWQTFRRRRSNFVMKIKPQHADHKFTNFFNVISEAFLQFPSVTDQHLTSGRFFFHSRCFNTKWLLFAQIHELPIFVFIFNCFRFVGCKNEKKTIYQRKSKLNFHLLYQSDQFSKLLIIIITISWLFRNFGRFFSSLRYNLAKKVITLMQISLNFYFFQIDFWKSNKNARLIS